MPPFPSQFPSQRQKRRLDGRLPLLPTQDQSSYDGLWLRWLMAALKDSKERYPPRFRATLSGYQTCTTCHVILPTQLAQAQRQTLLWNLLSTTLLPTVKSRTRLSASMAAVHRKSTLHLILYPLSLIADIHHQVVSTIITGISKLAFPRLPFARLGPMLEGRSTLSLLTSFATYQTLHFKHYTSSTPLQALYGLCHAFCFLDSVVDQYLRQCRRASVFCNLLRICAYWIFRGTVFLLLGCLRSPKISISTPPAQYLRSDVFVGGKTGDYRQ